VLRVQKQIGFGLNWVVGSVSRKGNTKKKNGRAVHFYYEEPEAGNRARRSFLGSKRISNDHKNLGLNPVMEFNQKFEAGSPNESESPMLVKHSQLCLTCLRMSVPQVLFKSKFRLEETFLLPA
jgi:hypothetical protein